jgi:hypothetical protein
MNLAPTPDHSLRQNLAHVGLALSLGASASIWWGEEPSKLASLICAFSVGLIGVCLIGCFSRRNPQLDPQIWLWAFALRMLVATLLVGAFWFEPDLSHRQSNLQPDGMGFDPVRWDEMSEQLALDGIFQSSKEVYRYGKEGIVYYTAGIYSIFGVSCIYVAWVNTLISMATLLLLSSWISENFPFRSRCNLMAMGLFIPEYLWFGSLVLKEAHNGLLFALFLTCFGKLVSRRLIAASSLLWIVGLVLTIAGIFVFQRAHIVTVMVFAVLAAIVSARPGRRLVVFLVAVLALSIVWAAESLLVSDSVLVASENEHALSGLVRPYGGFVSNDSSSINSMLSGVSVFERILFAIPRALAMSVTPFPRLGLWELWSDLESKWMAMGQTASRLSVIIYLALLPALLAGIIGCAVMPALRPARLLATMYVVFLLAISNGVLMLQERWRSTLWPFWLALVIVGWPYRKKYRWTLPLMVLAGVSLFWLIKTV